MKPTLPRCIWLLVLLCSTGAFAQQSNETQVQRLSLPNKNWSLDVSLEGFTVTNEQIKTAGPTYHVYAGWFAEKNTSPARMVTLTIYLEPAQSKGSASDFRDFIMNRKAKSEAVDKYSLTAFEYGQIPLIRFAMDLTGAGFPTVGGGSSQDKSLQAFFVKDDVWITVILSALPYRKDDEKLFYSVLDSVKFVDTSTPSSSFDYFQQGRSLFLQAEYQKAVEPLSKALEMEKQNAQLDKTQWRKLVLELANAHGAAGNKSAFDEVLTFGLTNDPTYYRFHFTRARMFASEGKLDETIASLEKAFLYQGNEIAAAKSRSKLAALGVEPLPDPLFDRAFERFRKDDKFRKAVKAMKK